MRNLAFIFLAACSAYDPDLGATPFLCGDTDPKCPDGYTCNANGAGKMVCEKGGSTDAMPMSGCANDSQLEPNDTIQTAWQSPVATARMNISLTGLAICPGTDKDNYKVDITTEGQNLEVILTYDPGNALSVSLLNSSGTSIVNGTPMGTNQVRAYAANLPMDSYYASIFSSAMMENNYRIDINVTGP